MVSLEDFRGKYVILYFYPRDGSPGCTIEAHTFQKDLPQYEAANAQLVGVSLNSIHSHQQFCAKQGLTFQLLSDLDGKVVESYGSKRVILGIAIAARNTFLIGPTGKILKVWTNVKPTSQSREVLQALSNAQHR